MAPKNQSSRDVLTGLPATRPQRRSARRDGAGGRPTPAAADQAAAPGAAASKPAAPRKARAAAATPSKAAPRKAAARATRARQAGPKVAAVRPAAARSQADRRKNPKVPPAGYATPRPQQGSGDDLLTGAVHAVGELAGLGLAIGERALRGALSRLPRL
jgi:hypothetical protein